MASEAGLGRTLVFFLDCGEFWGVGLSCWEKSINLLDYIFNSCFALTGIVRVRLILEGGLGEQF